ncbi:MAG: DUF4404 family protein [Candidatus Eisenbacteria bacterium]
MSDKAITDLLSQVQRTLEAETPITEQDRALLKQLSVDIQTLLAKHDAGDREGHQNVVDQLQAAVTRFEVSHPDLTATMSHVSKALGDMGI